MVFMFHYEPEVTKEPVEDEPKRKSCLTPQPLHHLANLFIQGKPQPIREFLTPYENMLAILQDPQFSIDLIRDQLNLFNCQEEFKKFFLAKEIMIAISLEREEKLLDANKLLEDRVLNNENDAYLYYYLIEDCVHA